MTIELFRPWEFYDTSDSAKCRLRTIKILVPAGRHEVKLLIPNPWYSKAEDACVIVLSGTNAGISREYLQSFVGEEHGISRVLIEG
jgi:hypothetical protein